MELGQTILVTQARTGSTRLPYKVLLKINNTELLKIQLDRLSLCKEINQIIVATTITTADDVIFKLCNNWKQEVFRGSEDDVLDRYYQTVSQLKPTWVVRVTSDCPLIDPLLVDAVVKMAKVTDVDYASNVLKERYPDGQDVEVFKFSALEKAWKEATLKSDREHVTLYIRNNSSFNGGSLFQSLNFPCAEDFSKIRMTVDEPKDFELIKKLIEDLGIKESWLTYTKQILNNNYSTINNNITRNEGLLKSLKKD